MQQIEDELQQKYQKLQQRLEGKRLEVASEKARRQEILNQKRQLVERLKVEFGIFSKEQLLSSLAKERALIEQQANMFIQSIYPFLNELESSKKINMPNPAFFSVDMSVLSDDDFIMYIEDLMKFKYSVGQFLIHIQGNLDALLYQQSQLQEQISKEMGVDDVESARSQVQKLQEKMRLDIQYSERKVEYLNKVLANA